MELETRVEKLERENRWLKRIGMTALIVGGLIVMLGQARPQSAEVLRASKFVLVDKEGRQRATLAIENGGPALEDTRGRGVARLQVPKIPDKPSLYLSDPGQSARVELAMTMNGPVMHFSDQAGTRVRLAANELNAPLAAIYGPEGEEVFFLAFGDAEGTVWRIPTARGEGRLLTNLFGRPGRLGNQLETDGQYLYFSWQELTGDLWVMDVSGSP